MAFAAFLVFFFFFFFFILFVFQESLFKRNDAAGRFNQYTVAWMQGRPESLFSVLRERNATRSEWEEENKKRERSNDPTEQPARPLPNFTENDVLFLNEVEQLYDTVKHNAAARFHGGVTLARIFLWMKLGELFADTLNPNVQRTKEQKELATFIGKDFEGFVRNVFYWFLADVSTNDDSDIGVKLKKEAKDLAMLSNLGLPTTAAAHGLWASNAQGFASNFARVSVVNVEMKLLQTLMYLVEKDLSDDNFQACRRDKEFAPYAVLGALASANLAAVEFATACPEMLLPVNTDRHGIISTQPWFAASEESSVRVLRCKSGRRKRGVPLEYRVVGAVVLQSEDGVFVLHKKTMRSNTLRALLLECESQLRDGEAFVLGFAAKAETAGLRKR
jgi:hypothetical protein